MICDNILSQEYVSLFWDLRTTTWKWNRGIPWTARLNVGTNWRLSARLMSTSLMRCSSTTDTVTIPAITKHEYLSIPLSLHRRYYELFTNGPSAFRLDVSAGRNDSSEARLNQVQWSWFSTSRIRDTRSIYRHRLVILPLNHDSILILIWCIRW